MSKAARGILLRIDGSFLLLAGGSGLASDLIGYYAGRGTWGAYLYGETYAIGFVEAHGLAVMIALLLLIKTTSDDLRLWHGLALAAHALMGGSNLVFWAIYGEAGIVALGVVVTVIHWLFVAAHAVALALPPAHAERSVP